MWDSQLGKITVAKLCIILNPLDVASSHTAPYRAEPAQHVLDKEEVFLMVKAIVAEPAIF